MARPLIPILFVLLHALPPVFGRGGGGGAGGGAGGAGGGYTGGGYIYGQGGSGSAIPIFGDGAWAFWLIVMILLSTPCFFWIRKLRHRRKRNRTRRLLKHLMTIDPVWEERRLKEHVESSFHEIQQAWCAQDLETLDALLTSSLFRDWSKKIRKAKKRGHRDTMADTRILRCNVMQVQDYLDDDRDNFTVELHVFSNDWTVDRDEKIIDKRDPLFTEFWTYRRKGDDWLLDLVRQRGEERQVFSPNIVEV
ncbi:TIM44-like domain-containing protein [Pontiellaceae bacterium B12227]|nr:TIM44-like domain-containing protein [Pontiellaceae bacterium B12227]